MAAHDRILPDYRRNGDVRWRFIAKGAEIRLRRRDVTDAGPKSVERRIDGHLPHAARIFGCQRMTNPDERRRWHVTRPPDGGREVGHRALRPIHRHPYRAQRVRSEVSGAEAEVPKGDSPR